jgi:hypothetical protein
MSIPLAAMPDRLAIALGGHHSDLTSPLRQGYRI